MQCRGVWLHQLCEFVLLDIEAIEAKVDKKILPLDLVIFFFMIGYDCRLTENLTPFTESL